MSQSIILLSKETKHYVCVGEFSGAGEWFHGEADQDATLIALFCKAHIGMSLTTSVGLPIDDDWWEKWTLETVHSLYQEVTSKSMDESMLKALKAK